VFPQRGYYDAAGHKCPSDEEVIVANLLWIQAVCCGGETASLLNSDHPHLQAALHTLGVTLLGHSYFHDQASGPADEVMRECAAGKKRVNLLLVEGAVPGGANSLVLIKKSVRGKR
jgi:Ni,Fe-hydrogenase I small subunit